MHLIHPTCTHIHAGSQALPFVHHRDPNTEVDKETKKPLNTGAFVEFNKNKDFHTATANHIYHLAHDAATAAGEEPPTYNMVLSKIKQ
jgi:hypothetical protein